MKKVHLIGTNIVTSPLGFGCAQLLRTSSAKQRQRILHAAYDAGIRHFDVARMYGLGAAERELGRFAQNKGISLDDHFHSRFVVQPQLRQNRLGNNDAL